MRRMLRRLVRNTGFSRRIAPNFAEVLAANQIGIVLDVGANVVATSATDSSPTYAPGLWSFGTPNRPRYFGAEIQIKF